MKKRDEEYRMTISPRGTLVDSMKNLFVGKGETTRVDGREYALRESGDLPPEEMRQYVKRCLENVVRQNPSASCTFRVPIDLQKLENPTLSVHFSRADNIPKLDEDTGEHQYFFVEGVRYKMQVVGHYDKKKISDANLIEQGRERIMAHLEKTKQMPNGVELLINYKEERSFGIGPFRIRY